MPPDRILSGAKFTLRPCFPFAYILAALLHGTPAAGVRQTLRRGTRNGITELSQRAPPIFGRAAIKLGIGPHSSYKCTAYSDAVAITLEGHYILHGLQVATSADIRVIMAKTESPNHMFIMVDLCNRQTVIFLPCYFYLLSFFIARLISAAADWMSTILPHMV